MKKILLGVALVLAISFFPSTIVRAAEKQAGVSAHLISRVDNSKHAADERVVALRNFLNRHNSPLVAYSDVFVKNADKYHVDWKLLPCISGVESSFGIAYLSGTYNAYGWGSGTIAFKSWEDGINTINKALRENYINRLGTDNVWSIGAMYAESKTWPSRVAGFEQQLNDDYIQVMSQTITLSI